MTRDHIFRECRKLVDILNNYGNVLVPSMPNKPETTTKERLVWIIEKAKNDYNLSIKDIEEGIERLD